MAVYFVRHGQTDWNVVARLQGKSDIPLNDTGRAQAVKTRDLLKEVKMDKIYCSPLQRAKETASIINELWHLPIIEDERLIERGFGKFEGVHRDEIDFANLWIYDTKPMFEGGEDTASFYARVTSFLDDIRNEAIENNILLVAHGGVSIPYQCYFNVGNHVEDLSSLIVDNCAVISYEVEKETV